MRFHKHLYSLKGNKRVANAVNEYGLREFAFPGSAAATPSTRNST